MKNKKYFINNYKLKENGITLVALVITIAIIIILASITISAVLGENGLIETAKQIKDDAEDFVNEENGKLGDLMEEYANVMGEDSNIPEGPKYPTEIEGVKIPEGFYYVGGTKEEGIVISDKEEDAGAGTSHEVAQKLQGNQFVWIPVENDSLFQRYQHYGSSKQVFDNSTEPYEEGYEGEVSEYEEMKQSVLENDGFYVGRYETGLEGEKTVIKQGKEVYNWISCFITVFSPSSPVSYLPT